MKTNQPVVYFTFDDGPHPRITPWVLDQLKEYNARATFFCVGDNVRKFPETYQQLLAGGHRPANHTFNHLNGWKTPRRKYLENIAQCAEWVDSDLFRPPYGKMGLFQLAAIRKTYRPVLWDILTMDYDKRVNPDTALAKIERLIEPGSILVFHDSEKAEKNLRVMLPALLRYCKQKGYTFEQL